MRWKEFKALGTEIAIMGSISPELLEKAEKMMIAFDKDYSRFVDGNILDGLNRATEFEASDELLDIIRKAKHYYELTNGIFDPTVIDYLEAIGYSNSFDRLDGNSSHGRIELEKNQHHFGDLVLDGNKIRKPMGLRLDLGGMGKGYIVDRISDVLYAGIDDYWISAGGDMLAKGRDQDGQAWQIKVQNPEKPEEDAFSLSSRGEKIAIATSGIIKRRGKNWHHLIDPRTGQPADNDIMSVTVIAPTVTQADVFAKTVLISGEKEGLEFIAEQDGSGCVIFKKNAEPVFSEGIKKYLLI